MSFTITAIFYGLIGLSVAVAVWLTKPKRQRGRTLQETTSRGKTSALRRLEASALTDVSGFKTEPYAERWFRILTAVCFWPIYLPLLLQPRSIESLKPDSATSPESAPDEFATMIDLVEGELDLALNSIPEWSNGNLASENVRIAELRSTWRDKADRMRELDALLARPSFVTDTFFVAEPTLATEPAATGGLTPNGTDFVSGKALAVGNSPENVDPESPVASAISLKVSAAGLTPSRSPNDSHEQSRQQNLAQLRSVRDGMSQDLINTLAFVRELITMIHLAKFTDAPTSRTAELIAQITATVGTAGATSVAGVRCRR